MSRAKKIWLIIATCLILIGCIIFVGLMAMLKWDFTKLSTIKYQTNNYQISEDFSAISIDTNTADIKIVPSENEICSVDCYEQKSLKHSVEVENGTLVIEVVDTRKWYEHIGINFGTPKITVYIPLGEYGALSVKSNTGDVEISKDFTFESIDISENTGDVTNYACASNEIKINTTTGNICVESISASVIDLSVSTGDITVSDVICDGDIAVGVSTGKSYLNNITCKSVISSGDTGDMFLSSVIAADKFYIERSTGDVKLDSCDAAEIFINTDTGDVMGSLLSEKVFIISTDTGKKDVPNTITGGRCEITTDTGDIKITIN